MNVHAEKMGRNLQGKVVSVPQASKFLGIFFAGEIWRVGVVKIAVVRRRLKGR